MDWQAHLRQTLQQTNPTRVCALDADAADFTARALPAAALHTGPDIPQPPCTLALGIAALSDLPARDAEQLIARTRIFFAPRLLLVAAPACALDEAAFRALGFELALFDRDAGTRVYHYDIETYKSVPDWLNARFWAHPERWEP